MKPEEFKFWCVTTPKSLESTIDDVLFSTDLRGFALQILGGLDHKNIISVTMDYEEARNRAMKVLEGWRIMYG